MIEMAAMTLLLGMLVIPIAFLMRLKTMAILKKGVVIMKMNGAIVRVETSRRAVTDVE